MGKKDGLNDTTGGRRRSSGKFVEVSFRTADVGDFSLVELGTVSLAQRIQHPCKKLGSLPNCGTGVD